RRQGPGRRDHEPEQPAAGAGERRLAVARIEFLRSPREKCRSRAPALTWSILKRFMSTRTACVAPGPFVGWIALAASAAFAAAGCGGEGGTLSAAELRDPAACQGCHPSQFAEWAGSMHAYASEDPVFLAMNQRGQRETNGALGDFCVRCHAPQVVRAGLTTD